MINLSLAEAQLFRLLENFFGADRVIHGMSTFSIAGGLVPSSIEDKETWIFQAKGTPCQFVILDHNEDAKLVIDLNFDYDGNVDLAKLERHEKLLVFLKQLNIPYVSIGAREFSALIDRDTGFTLVHLLQPFFDAVDV